MFVSPELLSSFFVFFLPGRATGLRLRKRTFYTVPIQWSLGESDAL